MSPHHRPRAEQPEVWKADAACRSVGPEIFFAYDKDLKAAAKAVCALCPVQVTCLEYAIKNREPGGVWGGVDFDEPRERRVATRRYS